MPGSPRAVPLPKAIERFWSKVDKKTSTGCWEYNGSITCWGYGQFTHFYKNYRAHKFAWEITYGKVPKNKILMHLCDNRKCVNIEKHIKLGTPKENSHDASRKGRLTSGENHWAYKVTQKERNEIIKFWYQGKNRKQLADQFNVHTRTITIIVNNKSVLKKYGKRLNPRHIHKNKLALSYAILPPSKL